MSAATRRFAPATLRPSHLSLSPPSFAMLTSTRRVHRAGSHGFAVQSARPTEHQPAAAPWSTASRLPLSLSLSSPTEAAAPPDRPSSSCTVSVALPVSSFTCRDSAKGDEFPGIGHDMMMIAKAGTEVQFGIMDHLPPKEHEEETLSLFAIKSNPDKNKVACSVYS